MDQSTPHSFVPESGFVPDAETAVAVATAVAARIYGKDMIDRQRPYGASLEGDTWTVVGSMPAGSLGGAFEVQLSRSTGKILHVTHAR